LTVVKNDTNEAERDTLSSEIPAGAVEKKLEEMVYQCPRSVMVAAWIFIVTLIIGLVIVLASLPSEIRRSRMTEFMLLGRVYHINMWTGATIYMAFSGLLVILGFLVLKGKMWAYCLLGVLMAYNVIDGIFEGGLNLLYVLILLLLVIGSKEYQQFCQSQRRVNQGRPTLSTLRNCSARKRTAISRSISKTWFYGT
jgi:hypothetical protein